MSVGSKRRLSGEDKMCQVFTSVSGAREKQKRCLKEEGRVAVAFFRQSFMYIVNRKVDARHRLVWKARLMKTVIDDSSVECHLEIQPKDVEKFDLAHCLHGHFCLRLYG